MDQKRQDVLATAMKLSAADRALLAEELLDSIREDEFDDDVREAWAIEIKRRIAELDAGTVETRSWDEVRSELVEAVARHGR